MKQTAGGNMTAASPTFPPANKSASHNDPSKNIYAANINKSIKHTNMKTLKIFAKSNCCL